MQQKSHLLISFDEIFQYKVNIGAKIRGPLFRDNDDFWVTNNTWSTSPQRTWLEDAMASWWRSYFAAGNSDLAVLDSIAMAPICSN